MMATSVRVVSEFVGNLATKTVGEELDNEDHKHGDHGESKCEGVVLEVRVETWRAKLFVTRGGCKQVNEGSGNNDTGTKVLGKVKGFLVDGELGNTSSEDGEKRDYGGRGPNNEDGADAETGGAGAVVDRATALRLISHVDGEECDEERWCGDSSGDG